MFRMPRRLGKADTLVRFVLGVALIALGGWLLAVLPSDWKLSMLHLFIAGGYLLGTAVAGTDPVYNAFDYSTNRDFRRQRPSP